MGLEQVRCQAWQLGPGSVAVNFLCQQEQQVTMHVALIIYTAATQGLERHMLADPDKLLLLLTKRHNHLLQSAFLWAWDVSARGRGLHLKGAM